MEYNIIGKQVRLPGERLIWTIKDINYNTNEVFLTDQDGFQNTFTIDWFIKALDTNQVKFVGNDELTSSANLSVDQILEIKKQLDYETDLLKEFIGEFSTTNEKKEKKMSVTKTEVKSTTNPTVTSQLDFEKNLQKVTTDVSKAVLNIVLTELDTRSNEIIVGITVNDKDLAKTKVEAHPELPKLINVCLNGLTPLLVGPAGCGKTAMAEQTSEALNLAYGHLCFSAGVSETWLFGRQLPTGFIEGEFSKLYKTGGVFLADELDAADANLLLAINTALANGHLYNPMSGEKITRHKDFHFIGAANTFGKGGNSLYTGRSRLDAATLDRFTCLEVDYLEQIENKLCPEKVVSKWLRDVRKFLKSQNSNEVISYRTFDKAFKMYNMGHSSNEVAKMLFASWPDNLKNNIPKPDNSKGPGRPSKNNNIPF